jgi:hypothetical protein
MTEWRFLQSFVISKRREAVTTTTPISARLVRIEVKPIVPLGADWYRAGWFNPVVVILGREYLHPSQVVPLQPAVFLVQTEHRFKVRFKPVPYLPKSIVKLYRSLEPATAPDALDGGQYG